jgi:hypothetical protein
MIRTGIMRKTRETRENLANSSITTDPLLKKFLMII